MKYRDEISAFKAGIIKTCQDRGLTLQQQDAMMAYVDAQIKQAAPQGQTVEMMEDMTPYLPSETDTAPAGKGIGSGVANAAKGVGNSWEKFTGDWKNDTFGMLMKSLPFMAGAGLIGGAAGGWKGAGIGGLLGLLGPLAFQHAGLKMPTKAPAGPITGADIKPPANQAQYPGDPNDHRNWWQSLMPKPKGKITREDIVRPYLPNTAAYEGDPNDYKGEL